MPVEAVCQLHCWPCYRTNRATGSSCGVAQCGMCVLLLTTMILQLLRTLVPMESVCC